MDFFNKLAKPVKILAPMVGHSEYAWRTLARRYGADICYTEMVHTEVFLNSKADAASNRWFTTSADDRPLVVQICGNNAARMLEAAKKLEAHCDAIDINLGCPQNIAKRGKYGAFLQDDPQLVGEIVSVLSKNLKVPLFCKIRVFEDVDASVAYAKMIEAHGCSLLAVHGRTREQRGNATGLASWKHIRAIKNALRIPVVANGNIVDHADIDACVAYTKCDGVMVAETHLHNPLIFVQTQASPIDIFNEYIDICDAITHPDRLDNVRPHLFKMFHRIFDKFPHLREQIVECKTLSDYRGLVRAIANTIGDQGEAQQKALLALCPKVRGEKCHVADFKS